jgi:hypothetical protein
VKRCDLSSAWRQPARERGFHCEIDLQDLILQ